MKKFIICAAVVLAAGFMVSCEEEAKCWKITVSMMGYSESAYVWGTEAEVEAAVAEYDGTGVDVSYKASDRAESDCY